MWWKEPVTSIRGIGNKKAADLAALNIYTVGDLLEHYPRQDSYTDFHIDFGGTSVWYHVLWVSLAYFFVHLTAKTYSLLPSSQPVNQIPEKEQNYSNNCF